MGVSPERRQCGLCWNFSGRSFFKVKFGVGPHSTQSWSLPEMAEDINQEGPDQMEGRVKIWLVEARVRAEVKGKARAAGESGQERSEI